MCLWDGSTPCACGDVGKKLLFVVVVVNFEYKAFLKEVDFLKLKEYKQNYLKLQTVITEIYKIPF